MLMRATVTGLLVLAAGAWAQGPQPGGGRGRFGPGMEGGPGWARFLGAEAGMPGRVVKNAPFSADVVTESTQTLADGSHIHQTNTVHVYRDSEGRTRREQSLQTLGGLAPNANLPQVVFINDPVAGANYALNASTHTANKTLWNHSPGPGQGWQRNAPRAGAAPNGRGPRHDAANQNVKTDALGRQAIEGVQADGRRSTMTIPAGRIGNEQPLQIVTETWYSQDLQMVVMSKRTDPRTGETITRLSNISRAEPPASMFEVPADYKVNETVGRPNRGGTPGAAK